jgi:hypothetical protein
LRRSPSCLIVLPSPARNEVLRATKNPPDGFIERVSSKEVTRRLREPRGPDHSNGPGRSNTGKRPIANGKNARLGKHSSTENDLELISVREFALWLCRCFPVFDRQ